MILILIIHSIAVLILGFAAGFLTRYFMERNKNV